ncbi:zinc finger and BTB domain-containing protein 12-like [Acipenser ruthenus]|uniref:zinc finger and BTB domain-containing protein 12-like n=1 Tax=Acipenser ruthenus TaxID=7906 RepID=UPI00145A0937|nr:zinc finger and BTB domain-containing protein 12-like [Acipenser ruthenus]
MMALLPSGGPTEILRFQLPGHGAATLRNTNQLRSDQRFCDITIVANDNLKFRGHRVILAACSPFLRDQFLLNPSSELQVSLLHSSRIVADLLLSCYTGLLEFGVRDIVNYLTAASYLQMEHVVEKCRAALTQFIEPQIHSLHEGAPGASAGSKGKAGAGGGNPGNRKGAGLTKQQKHPVQALSHSHQSNQSQPSPFQLLQHSHQHTRYQHTTGQAENPEELKVKVEEFPEDCADDFEDEYEELSDVCIVEDGGSMGGWMGREREREEGVEAEGGGSEILNKEEEEEEDNKETLMTTNEAQTTSTTTARSSGSPKTRGRKPTLWDYRRQQQGILGREGTPIQEGDGVHSTGEGLGGGGGEEEEGGGESSLGEEREEERGFKSYYQPLQEHHLGEGHGLAEVEEEGCVGLECPEDAARRVGSTSSSYEGSSSFSVEMAQRDFLAPHCGLFPPQQQPPVSLGSSGVKTIKCSRCEEFFQSVERLVTHMRASHCVFMCPRCGKQFNHTSNLNRHMNVHRGIKSHACHVCAKSFTQKSTLYDHMNLHSGERPYRCSYCHVRFAHKPAIRRHLKEQHGKTTAENCMDANSVAEINVVVR